MSRPSDVSLPLSLDKPPPSANKLQIELWKRILVQRYQQLQELTTKELQFYVNIIKNGTGTDQQTINNVKYATRLINRQSTSSTITIINDVKQHFVALFYCSIDETVSLEERKLALDTLQKDFASLDALKKGTISPPDEDQQAVNSSSGGIGDNKEQSTNHEKDSSKTSSSSKRAREEVPLNINASENPSNKQIRRENNNANDTTISTEKQITNYDKQKQAEKASKDKQTRNEPEVVIIDLESTPSKKQKIGHTTISSSKSSLPRNDMTSPSMKNKNKIMKGESVTDDKKISSSKPLKRVEKSSTTASTHPQ